MAEVWKDARGRFVKGGPGGPGRPRRSVEESYLQTLYQVVKREDWREIIQKAVEQAKKGDDRARRWLSEYLVGKPTEYVAADVTSGGQVINFVIECTETEAGADSSLPGSV